MSAKAKGTTDPRKTSAKLIEEFRIDCEIRDMKSTKSYVSAVNRLAEFLSERGKDVLQVDRRDLIDYLIYLKDRKTKYANTTHNLKSDTLERSFTAISSFYTFLVEEEHIAVNPVIPIRRRYLKKYKEDSDRATRHLISVEEASTLVNSILNTRDKAILTLLFKTGMRIGELTKLDVSDVDLSEGTITLKNTAKRSNRVLFIDGKAITMPTRWLAVRNTYTRKDTEALFPSNKTGRLCIKAIQIVVNSYAEKCGLHDPSAGKIEDRFSPHCCRHWFTTHLIRSGMPRDFVKELRGDSRHDAIDIYNHIDKKELRESYLAHIPQLGI
jgi:integrase/recombinase XerD